MRVVFKLDRVGHGIETRYENELEFEDLAFIPGLDDFVRLRSTQEATRLQYQVYRRTTEIVDDGSMLVTVYADNPMALMRRRNAESRVERAKADLWRGDRR